MIGSLHKMQDGWYVEYVAKNTEQGKWKVERLPLYPEKGFDNDEAYEGKPVRFDIVIGALDFKSYAALVHAEYPELEGTISLCEDVVQKRIGKLTEQEWLAAEAAQTSTAKEISDEEIYAESAKLGYTMLATQLAWEDGAKWYREQIKTKNHE